MKRQKFIYMYVGAYLANNNLLKYVNTANSDK